MKKLFMLFIVLLVSNGCSNIKYLGKIGKTKFFSIHASYLDGPNFTAFVTERYGVPMVRAVMTGPGLATVTLPAMFGAAGNVASSFIFGKNLKRTKVNNNNYTNTNSSQKQEQKQEQSD